MMYQKQCLNLSVFAGLSISLQMVISEVQIQLMFGWSQAQNQLSNGVEELWNGANVDTSNELIRSCSSPASRWKEVM